jgi:hypothetical protein
MIQCSWIIVDECFGFWISFLISILLVFIRLWQKQTWGWTKHGKRVSAIIALAFHFLPSLVRLYLCYCYISLLLYCYFFRRNWGNNEEKSQKVAKLTENHLKNSLFFLVFIEDKLYILVKLSLKIQKKNQL